MPKHKGRHFPTLALPSSGIKGNPVHPEFSDRFTASPFFILKHFSAPLSNYFQRNLAPSCSPNHITKFYGS